MLLVILLMSDVKYIRILLPEQLHFMLKNKCSFRDISMQEVFSLCAEKFINGDFDKELGLEIDE